MAKLKLSKALKTDQITQTQNIHKTCKSNKINKPCDVIYLRYTTTAFTSTRISLHCIQVTKLYQFSQIKKQQQQSTQSFLLVTWGFKKKKEKKRLSVG